MRFGSRALLPLCLAVLPAHAEDPAAALGKARAITSTLEWEIREAGHPALGNIRFAFLRTPIETPVGSNKVFSRAYLSCEKTTKKLAFELTNGVTHDDTGGLKPAIEPRLVCVRPVTPAGDKMVQETLLANWDVNKIGDALTRGFRPFPLRECVAIRVLQEVTLPAGWSQKTAKVEFEILPYDKDVDSVFVTCGEESAYASATPAAPPVARAEPVRPPSPAYVPVKPNIATAPPPAPPKLAPAPTPPPKLAAAPAPAPTPPPAPATGAWQSARVLASGKTNVRAGPNLTSAIVIQLDPGAPVQVQKTGNDWWRAKASSGAPFEGYIREDRLSFK